MCAGCSASMRGEGLMAPPAAICCCDGGAAAKPCPELLLPDGATLPSPTLLWWPACHRMAAPAGGSCPALAACMGAGGR